MGFDRGHLGRDHPLRDEGLDPFDLEAGQGQSLGERLHWDLREVHVLGKPAQGCPHTASSLEAHDAEVENA